MVQLQGYYLFGDTTSTRIGALNYCGDEAASNVQVVEGVMFAGAGDSLMSFGRDGQGELYIVSTNGSIRRLIAPD